MSVSLVVLCLDHHSMHDVMFLELLTDFNIVIPLMTKSSSTCRDRHQIKKIVTHRTHVQFVTIFFTMQATAY